MKKRVHVVPHMHWDREWYFSTEESQILLVNNMEEIMDLLENNPDYPSYVLDGQMAVLEDYFQVKPENKARVQKLVQSGRLKVGPWVSQTDEMTTGAESITRNLLYGYKDCRELGAEPMAIGYIPDSFGQTAQMPMILNQFDIKYSIFWRGVSERHGSDKTEFYWESDDGSRVLVQLFPLGYAIGKYLPEDEEALKKRLDVYFQVLDKGAVAETELLPNGHDQMPIQQNIFLILEKLRKLYPEREFFLSRYEDVFAELEQHEGLDTLHDEFIDGKYSRVHRSIFGQRMDLKAMNCRIENKLTNVLEPLMSLAYKLGFSYEHGLLEVIWKLLLKNHAHDSMGACCSDKVHQEIAARYREAEERCDRLIDFYKRKIIEAVPDKGGADKLGLFNLLPYAENRLVHTLVTTRWSGFELFDRAGNKVDYQLRSVTELDPGLIDRQIVHYGNYEPFFRYEIELTRELPAMGYEVLYVREALRPELIGNEVPSVETDFYQLTGNSDGTVNIKDKLSNRTYTHVFSLDDTADDGDEYDFSPLADEVPISSLEQVTDSQVKIVEYAHEFVLTSTYHFTVPSNLTADRQRSSELTELPVKLELHISRLSRIIGIKLTVNNQAKDHRLRLLIPTEIASTVSFANHQFGTIKRPVIDEALSYWQDENWDERPDAIYPYLGYVGLADDAHAVGILTNSSREYEIVGTHFDTIAITVLRCVGYLGKAELYRRPGRPSGILLPTPDSQMQGKLTLDLALTFTENMAQVAQDYKRFVTQVECYNQMPYHAMKLNKTPFNVSETYSLLTQSNDQLVLSTLKKAEDSAPLLARFYNPSDTEMQLSLENQDSLILYSLKETIRDRSWEGKVKPNQVVTVRVGDNEYVGSSEIPSGFAGVL